MQNETNKNSQSVISSIFGEDSSHKRVIKSVKAKADLKRTTMEKVADWFTAAFGSLTFLIFNSLFFASWLVINTKLISFIPAFDPFPFSLLTTIVSLEAIILAIFVLISQNRTERVDDLREEILLQLNITQEKEMIKIMKMLSLVLEKNGINISNDPELKKLLKPVSEEELERALEKEIF